MNVQATVTEQRTFEVVRAEIHIPDFEVDDSENYEGDGRFPASMKFAGGVIVSVEAETGRIVNWPDGLTLEATFKVRDSGSYFLFGKGDLVLAEIKQDYVPACFDFDKGYGDYITLKVASNGQIQGWSNAFTPAKVAASFWTPRD